ncbi:MAG: oligosaccharide flippase family protein, partial [Patescibacteria group bacterium]
IIAFRVITAFIAYIVAGSIIWFFPYNLEIKLAVQVASIAFFLIAVNQILTGIFQKHLQAVWVGVGEAAQRAALLISVIIVMRGDHGFLAIMIATVAAGIVQTVVLAVRAHRITPLGFAFDRAVWSEIFKKSWPIAISIAFNLIYLRADILILSLVRTQSEVGLYGAAYRIMDVTTAVPIIFMGLLLPLLSAAWTEKNQERFQHLVERGFTIFSIVAIPMLFGGILLATPLMRLIAGREFVASGPIVQILLIALMGGFLGALFGHTIVAINHQRKTIWIYMVTAALTLIGYLIFIPSHGVLGAAWMTVFSEVLAGALLWGYVRHVTRAHVSFAPLLKAIIASLVMMLVLLPLRELHVLILIALGALVYGLAIVALRGVPLETVRGLLKRTS